MRTFRVLLIAAFTLAPAWAGAQVSDLQGVGGTVDFGVRGTTTSGDPARYERYRDLGDGLFMDTLDFFNHGDRWWVDFKGDHVGRDDMRYRVDAVQHGRYKFWGVYDQIPMLLSRTTETLFLEPVSPAGLVMDATTRAAFSVANEATRRTIFDEQARTFELNTTRYITEGGMQFIASPSWTVNALARYTNRQGDLPLGGTFGHSIFVEMPGAVEHKTTDLEGSAEYSNNTVLVKVGANASLFRNEAMQFAWDNPFSAVDRAAPTPPATQPPAVSAAGRLALAPGSNYLTLNGLFTAKMPGRSRFTAYLATGSLTDNGNYIMPQTINSAIDTVPLERAFVEGKARTNAANLTFTARPRRGVGIDVRYRFYDYDNQTPVFDVVERVPYEYTRSAGVLETEPQSVQRQTFNADLLLDPASRASIGAGYFAILEDRTHRVFESTSENGFRAWFDTVSMATFSVRTKWEYSQKRTDTTEEEAAEFLSHFGEQALMRHYDLAERDRNRVTVVANWNMTANFMVNASVAAGKDEYVDSGFGLQDNTHGIYTVGFDGMPNDMFTYGMSYSYEDYKANSVSRQASPNTPTGCVNTFPAPPGFATCEFYDPRRDWGTDARDKIHSFLLNFAAREIADVLDIVVSYDFNKAKSTYDYLLSDEVERTAPEDVVYPPTLLPPDQLPPTLSQFNRLESDFIYKLNERFSVGFSYWLEDYDVEDFTLDAESTPNLVRGTTMLLGYLYKPYTAQTFWGRFIIRF